MEIDPKEIKGKPRQIGRLKKSPVFAIQTRGGLNLVVVKKASGTETLALAPHPAISLHIALKRNPDLEITELTKGEFVPLEAYSDLVEKYEELTDEFRAVEAEMK